MAAFLLYTATMKKILYWTGTAIGLWIVLSIGSITITKGQAGGPSIDLLTVSNVSLGASISAFNITENTTTNLYAHGSASDPTGCTDIDTAASWDNKTFRTSLGSNCAADGRNCYHADEVAYLSLTNCTGGGDSTIDFEQIFQIKFYADPTSNGSQYASDSWTVRIKVTDESENNPAFVSATFEMNELTALEVFNGPINFGTLALGETTSAAQSLLIRNTGNNAVDYAIQAGASMSCASGRIPAIATEYSFSAFFSHGINGSDITTSAVTLDRNLGAGSDAGDSQENIYFKLQVPVEGAGGSCSNTIQFTAVDAG